MKYQYKVAFFTNTEDYETWLNNFGQEGWELVTSGVNTRHVFKRQLKLLPNWDAFL